MSFECQRNRMKKITVSSNEYGFLLLRMCKQFGVLCSRIKTLQCVGCRMSGIFEEHYGWPGKIFVEEKFHPWIRPRRFPSRSTRRQIPGRRVCPPRSRMDSPPESAHATVLPQWTQLRWLQAPVCRAQQVCRGKLRGQTGLDLKVAFALHNLIGSNEPSQPEAAGCDDVTM